MSKKVGLYTVLTIILFIFIIPYLWMFLTALKTLPEVMAWPPKFIPEKLNFKNFIEIFQGTIIPRAFVNTLIVATV